MDNLQSGSLPQWMQEVDTRMHMPPEERNSLPLHNIIKAFKEYIEKGPTDDPKKIAQLANRIKILSEGRLNYYENSSIGSIVKEISSIANLLDIDIYKTSGAIGMELSTPHIPKKDRLSKNFQIDPKFVCDQSTFNDILPGLKDQLEASKEFNVTPFLAGPKGSSAEDLNANQKILDNATSFMQQQAEKLAKEKGISREDAYKLLIGVLDKFDDEAIQIRQLDKKFVPQSTFALRSAILQATVNEGIELQSWMVYTKSGKALQNDVWPFLDNWKNWVPEAQGALAKFTEATFIKAKGLADHSISIRKQEEIGNGLNGTEETSRVNEDASKKVKDQVILLKGGFGAGKTRFTAKLPSVGDEHAQGVIAPDLGKRVVRRAMESVPHASAHVQGSQIAYKLFDEMIQHQVGDVVYDSSLARATDVTSYLVKSQKANKKMVVYDIARNDMARVLSVLKRTVGGDDPRIGPDFIIKSALLDKVNRAECMQVVLNAKVKEGQEMIAPEYRFVGTDAKGWGTKEVMVIRPGSITQLDNEMKERLALEGIEINEENNAVHLIKSSEEYENYYKTQFDRPVKDLLAEIETSDVDGKGEYNRLSGTFSGRSFDLVSSEEKTITDTSSLYKSLPEKIKKALPEKALEEAFKSVGPNARKEFFAFIKDKTSFSYLDLPLSAALIINKNLQSDPWL